MKPKNSIMLTLTVALLVTGSLIGAGILALPIKTGLSGFIPSLVGILIGFLMYVVWVHVTVGALPLEGEQYSLIYAFQHDYPATIPLSEKINLPVFTYGSLLFAVFAITTSYIACGTGLLAFINDLAINHLHIKNKYSVIIFAFGPPLIISLFYPDIFLEALDIVGGFGIVILFGILPSIIAIKKAKSFVTRLFCILILLLFVGFLGLETMQEFGLLEIKPHVEHWKTPPAISNNDLPKGGFS